MIRITSIMALLTILLVFVTNSHAAKSEDERPPITKSTPKADTDQLLNAARASIAKSRAGEQINWQVIASGGTNGSSASYILKGTAGQVTVGGGSSTNFGIRNGYWQTFSGGSPTCCMGSMRGNINSDPGDGIDISDLVYLVDWMFTGGAAPTCLPEANVNGNGADDAIDISDLVYLVDYMFTGGPPPPPCP